MDEGGETAASTVAGAVTAGGEGGLIAPLKLR